MQVERLGLGGQEVDALRQDMALLHVGQAKKAFPLVKVLKPVLEHIGTFLDYRDTVRLRGVKVLREKLQEVFQRKSPATAQELTSSAIQRTQGQYFPQILLQKIKQIIAQDRVQSLRLDCVVSTQFLDELAGAYPLLETLHLAIPNDAWLQCPICKSKYTFERFTQLKELTIGDVPEYEVVSYLIESYAHARNGVPFENVPRLLREFAKKDVPILLVNTEIPVAFMDPINKLFPKAHLHTQARDLFYKHLNEISDGNPPLELTELAHNVTCMEIRDGARVRVRNNHPHRRHLSTLIFSPESLLKYCAQVFPNIETLIFAKGASRDVETSLAEFAKLKKMYGFVTRYRTDENAIADFLVGKMLRSDNGLQEASSILKEIGKKVTHFDARVISQRPFDVAIKVLSLFPALQTVTIYDMAHLHALHNFPHVKELIVHIPEQSVIREVFQTIPKTIEQLTMYGKFQDDDFQYLQLPHLRELNLEDLQEHLTGSFLQYINPNLRKLRLSLLKSQCDADVLKSEHQIKKSGYDTTPLQHLSRFTDLRSLNLEIITIYPANWQFLRSISGTLQELKLRGHYTDEDLLQHASHLRDLRSLHVFNWMTGLCLGAFPKLEELEIQSSKLKSRDLVCVERLQHLRRLSLSFCGLDDLQIFRSLPQALTYLDCSVLNCTNLQEKDFAHIGRLKNLRRDNFKGVFPEEWIKKYLSAP